jgi:hypothetical protein
MEHQFQQPLSETRAQLRSGDVACRRRQRQQIISAPPIVRSPCATLVLRTSASESHVAQSLGPLSLARALNPPDMGNSPDRDPTPFTHDAGGDPTAAALRCAMLGGISAGRATPWAAACMDPEARVRRLILCATPREWCGVATCALGLARTVEQIEAVVLIVGNPNMRTSFKARRADPMYHCTAHAPTDGRGRRLSRIHCIARIRPSQSTLDAASATRHHPGRHSFPAHTFGMDRPLPPARPPVDAVVLSHSLSG